jgi:hypothetical protein
MWNNRTSVSLISVATGAPSNARHTLHQTYQMTTLGHRSWYLSLPTSAIYAPPLHLVAYDKAMSQSQIIRLPFPPPFS